MGEPEIAVRTKARAKLGALFEDDVEAVLPALSGLLRPPVEAGEPNVAAYLRWVEALGDDRPVVVAIEDLHWADETTLRLAEGVLELTDRAPVALALTQELAGTALRLRALTEFAHRTTELALSPLSDEAADRLLAEILGHDVDAADRVRLVREAEGSPLYLEELARAFLEGGLPFTHGLLQEAALSTLTAARKRGLSLRARSRETRRLQ